MLFVEFVDNMASFTIFNEKFELIIWLFELELIKIPYCELFLEFIEEIIFPLEPEISSITASELFVAFTKKIELLELKNKAILAILLLFEFIWEIELFELWDTIIP